MRSTARSPQRSGNRHRWMAPHNCYKAAGDDDKWVSIAVGTESEWRALCQVNGQPALAERSALSATLPAAQAK